MYGYLFLHNAGKPGYKLHFPDSRCTGGFYLELDSSVGCKDLYRVVWCKQVQVKLDARSNELRYGRIILGGEFSFCSYSYSTVVRFTTSTVASRLLRV